MSEHLSNEELHVAGHRDRLLLDPRQPKLLDDREHALQVKAGYVDVFAIDTMRAEGRRLHLFRVEPGGILLDLHRAGAGSRTSLQIIAVGSSSAELAMLPRSAAPFDGISGWITQLARLTAQHGFPDTIGEFAGGEISEMQPGERRRGPMRSIAWVRLAAGTAKLMGFEPPFRPGDQPIPLTAGLWIEAGAGGCRVSADAGRPDGPVLWPALDRFHSLVVAGIEADFARAAVVDRERLVRRIDLAAAQSADGLERLAEVVVGKPNLAGSEFDLADPLLSSCRIVADKIGATIPLSVRSGGEGRTFGDVLNLARSARLRVRRVQLRGDWWQSDAGPLVGWHGSARDPVALIRDRRNGYTMIDPGKKIKRPVDRPLAAALSPEAVSFYPTLPSSRLGYLDLLGVSTTGTTGSIVRIAFAVLFIGLLSIIQPLITNFLVNSVIPRTEIDQLVVCGLALIVVSVSVASLQAMEGLVTLRLEGLIDYRLQAALIDRLLRLPAALFRQYTAGDLVDRAMGINTARSILTGRALRGMTASLFSVFSLGLMFYYDLKLGGIALLLTLVRAAAIVGTSLVRIYYESRHFNLQGRISGLVLQLIAGVGKLRVANATGGALALWSRQFANQKRNFIASQRAANVLSVFETSYPTLATLVIFAIAEYNNSRLLLDLGAFLGFLSAFGQTMSSIGTWAASVSESLVAIPHLRRLKPLIDTTTESPEERKSPGELEGEIELSGITFRYVTGGPPVLDDLSLRIQPGEYVAIVGPSGSGKSSLLRLLLGFEQPEAGSIFYDGKALNTLEIGAVRRQLGVVLQDTKLATGSIYENICGGVEMPLEKVWEAARQAGLDADISQMPMGMNTVVAEGVNTLSGGQRQRILISRAIARSPRIMLFDEATSALDNQTQAIVAASLDRLAVTRIVIAHRLSTVRNADRIVMLIGGKLAQIGSYNELMAVPGPFAEFAQRQLLGSGDRDAEGHR
jgi:NHLM bacteriocin system ABC transporter ATP-binding protein